MSALPNLPETPDSQPLQDEALPDTSGEVPAASMRQRRQLRLARRQAAEEAQGVPIWLPLAALVIAFIFALFIAIRIGPTLSALVSPPDPVLPPDTVLQSHESKGTEDQWLYATKTSGCRVARLYATAFGACKFDPSSGCSPTNDQGDSGGLGVPGTGGSVAECSGIQVISNYHINWHVYISTTNDKNQPVIFRVYREIS